MCGIVGFAGRPMASDINRFEQLLYVDALRGYDATGVAFVKKDGEHVPLIKAGLNAAEFFGAKAKTIKDLMGEPSSLKGIIGHNRAATVGGLTDEAAHPFKHGHIVGVHNGTLSANQVKNLPHKHDKAINDSDALYASIAAVGLKETVGNCFGAFALVYFDMKDNAFHIIRNNDRSLSYSVSLWDDITYWGSEAQMLRWILGRSAGGEDSYDKRFKPPVSFKPFVHYRIEVDVSGTTTDSVSMEEVGEYKPVFKTTYSPPYIMGYGKKKAKSYTVDEAVQPCTKVPTVSNSALSKLTDDNLEKYRKSINEAAKEHEAKCTAAKEKLVETDLHRFPLMSKAAKRVVKGRLKHIEGLEKGIYELNLAAADADYEFQTRKAGKVETKVIVFQRLNKTADDYRLIERANSCAICSENNIHAITIEKCIRLKDDLGFVCDSCSTNEANLGLLTDLAEVM